VSGKGGVATEGGSTETAAVEEGEAKFCSECGAKNTGSKFCSECGHSL
jgi:membrane protease subunit (stomatin/prohibitin family)